MVSITQFLSALSDQVLLCDTVFCNGLRSACSPRLDGRDRVLWLGRRAHIFGAPKPA